MKRLTNRLILLTLCLLVAFTSASCSAASTSGSSTTSPANTAGESTASPANTTVESTASPAATAGDSTADLYTKYPQYNVADKSVNAKFTALIKTDSTYFTSVDDWWWWEFMKRVTGVTVEPKLVEKTVYNEQLAIMMTSGDLPDIIWNGFDNKQVVDYGATQRIFIPLNDYVKDAKLMPKLNKLFAEFPDALSGSTCYDGNIYGLPSISSSIRNTASATRAIWDSVYLQDVGVDWKSIKTLDDMYNALKASVKFDYNKNGKADEVGWTMFWGTDGMNGMHFVVGYILGAYNISTTNGLIGVNNNTKQAGLVAMMDGYYDSLVFLNKLYSEHLLDNDLFSQSETDMVNKMSNSQAVFSTYFNPGYFKLYSEHNNDAFWQHMLVWQTPVVEKSGGTPIAPVGSKHGFNQVVVTKACKDVDLVMKWLDVCYDPMISFYYYSGAEYGSEDDIDQDGYTYLKDKYDFVWTDAEKAHGKDGMNEWEFLNRINCLSSRTTCGIDDAYYINSEEGKDKFGDFFGNMKDWCDQYLDQIAPYEVTGYPDTIYFTNDQVQTIAKYTSDVDSYIAEQASKFISGKTQLNEANWKIFLSGLAAAGGNELNDVYSTAYQH